MKVITVRQPWAWAIAKGYKDIENRGWTTTYRGPLAIHAAKKWDDAAEAAVRAVRDLARAQGKTLPERLIDDHPVTDVGVIVAVVALVGICTVNLNKPDPVRCDCGPWAQPGQAHWQLAGAHLLPEPIPAKGRLGLWEADVPAISAALEVQP
jgi:hypothetical protein